MPSSLHCGYFPGCPLPHCLHLSTAVVISGSIRWPQGSAQSQRCPRGSSAPALAGFCPWPCFQCLFSLPPVFAGSWSSLFLPHRLCNWDTFTHHHNNNNNNNNNSPHRKACWSLNKHFSFLMITGYTNGVLQQGSCFGVHGIKWPLQEHWDHDSDTNNSFSVP